MAKSAKVIPLKAPKAEDENVVKLTMDISPKMPVKDKKTGKSVNPNKTTANNPVVGYMVTLDFTSVSRPQCVKGTLPAHIDVLKNIVEQARGQNPVNKEKRFNTMKKSVDALTDEQKAEMLALLTKNDAKATSKALRK